MHVLPSKEALAESSPGYMLPPQQELGMENGSQLGETRAGNWFQSCQAPGLLLGSLHCPGVTLLRQTIRKESEHFHSHFKGLCHKLCPGVAVNDLSGILMDLELQPKLSQSLTCTHRALRGNRKIFYPAPGFVHCRNSSALHSRS